MLDSAPLRDAYRALLEAADTVTGSAETDTASDTATATTGPVPPPGEWNAHQILAHVVILNAVTIAAVTHVSSGAPTTYDNRTAQDAWTLERVITRTGGGAGLRDRIRIQADALCALGGRMLGEAELDTPVPTLLVSNGAVLVDRPMPLRDLLTGLAEAEIPGHTKQLLALAG